MSSSAKYNRRQVSSLPQISLVSSSSYERDEEPAFPALNIARSPHAGIDAGERSYFFEDPASFVIASIGLAAADLPFRMTPPNEEGLLRLDTSADSHISLRRAGELGQFTIAENLGIEWSSTPDTMAIPQIWGWAEEHAETLHNFEETTVNEGQNNFNPTEEAVALVL